MFSNSVVFSLSERVIARSEIPSLCSEQASLSDKVI